ncbi:MAG: PepSY domain-containing protein [Saprospiraceae bacterium]
MGNQIDGQSGEIYSISRRYSDWIEQLHDGSIIAEWFKWLSMNYLGLGLIVMIITGTWLWWGPKRIRNLKLKS